LPQAERDVEDVIKVHDQHYILATSSRTEERTRVLKHGDTFAVFDPFGDLRGLGFEEQGLYHEGTRHLSRFQLRLGIDRPLLLSSSVKADNDLLAVDLTNADITEGDEVVLRRGTVHIFRSKLLWNGTCHERLRISNYGLRPIRLPLRIQFDADFADIFEIRGDVRAQRGQRLPEAVDDDSVVLSYRGLDGVTRRTRLAWTPVPAELDGTAARFDVALDPGESTHVTLAVCCDSDEAPTTALAYDDAMGRIIQTVADARAQRAEVYTSNEQFNEWVSRSASDLEMLITQTGEGPYPYAGVPWFSTPFGRDGIITALELLWCNPRVARGVLRYLAATQSQEVNPERDAGPGKILHETRKGEMAALGEVPFGRYYGSVDATPLFVVLAGAYFERTADVEFLEWIWPHVEGALSWLDRYGDADGDGFVEYARRSSTGLVHQGWKDSQDSVFHADGTLAAAPIALCEVQAYVYEAKSRASHLAEVLGLPDRAGTLRVEAERLRERFEDQFWRPDLGTYALALDGHKRPCDVRTSNAGHCLYAGIARPDRARTVIDTLLEPESFSGWGIRTVAASEARYNPMSYHNGSVWPHDNALIAAGFARYGDRGAAQQILTGLFDTSLFVDLRRIPELFCGFRRRTSEGPTLYPVACAPQAWAAAGVFLLLQACLGLSIDAPARRIRFLHPTLPEFLQRVEVRNLSVAGGRFDFVCERHAYDVGVNILRRGEGVEIVVVK
jgi:glycogen debranching enzyme